MRTWAERKQYRYVALDRRHDVPEVVEGGDADIAAHSALMGDELGILYNIKDKLTRESGRNESLKANDKKSRVYDMMMHYMERVVRKKLGYSSDRQGNLIQRSGRTRYLSGLEGGTSCKLVITCFLCSDCII